MTLGKAADSGDQLLYQREIFINPSRTHQWISVKLFTLRCDVDDDTALTLLIAHPCYRDAYAGVGGVGQQEAEPYWHGPYWLSLISPNTFVKATPDAAAEEIDTFAERTIQTWDGPYARWHDADLEATRREVHQRFLRATTLYQLPDIRATAQHDWGQTVGSESGFHEFVTIDRRSRELALIVASDD